MSTSPAGTGVVGAEAAIRCFASGDVGDDPPDDEPSDGGCDAPVVGAALVCGVGAGVGGGGVWGGAVVGGVDPELPEVGGAEPDGGGVVGAGGGVVVGGGVVGGGGLFDACPPDGPGVPGEPDPVADPELEPDPAAGFPAVQVTESPSADRTQVIFEAVSAGGVGAAVV